MEFKTVHEMYRHWAETRPGLPAYYVKRQGGYVPVSWQAFGQSIRDFAVGLMALGMEYRDPVSILGLTRPEWDIADKAAMSAGGIAVGVYHSNTAAQVHHVVHHSESRFLIVENRQQWEKVRTIRKDLPHVKRFIVMDPWEGAAEEGLVSFEEVLDLGRRERPRHEQEYRRRFESVAPDDTAILFYTSGTTGPPKAAMLTHANVLAACEFMRDLKIFTAQDTSVLWLPMPHIYGRIAMIAGTYTGTVGYYAESLDKMIENLQEIRPTIFYSVPRIFEKVHSRVLSQAAESSPLKRKIFAWALATGLRRSRMLREGALPPRSLEWKYRLADRLVFRKVRQVFGGRIRILISGGAPIAKEILEFFHGAGILPLELYGITEVLGCTMNRPDRYRLGSVGPPGPGVELRLAEDGEILIRSKMVFKGYLKDPEKTAEVLSPDGWYATGDIGTVDQDGFVWITDRKKDILITAGGKNVAPQNIENILKTSPYISQALVCGDRKPYLTALITLDPEEMRKWAQAQGIEVSSLQEMASHPRVTDFIDSIVRDKNRELAQYEQIKAFRIVPEEFSQDSGTLTATLKVRRREVVKKYGHLIDEMYQA